MSLRAKGMREWLPSDEIKRKWIVGVIEKHYRLYGFDPVSHPAIERLDVLEAKSGEGIKTEIFRFDDNELGLRFDLTVPLARMFAEHQDLPLPFKRYSIDKVWRREEPQHGRYREFMQGDADVLGSPTMSAEAELIACAVDILNELGITDFEIRLNNRKISTGLLSHLGVPEDKHGDVLRIIDKLDKKSVDEVKLELESAGFSPSILDEFNKSLDEFKVISECAEGASEVKELFELLSFYGIESVIFDPYIARGLGYYTGTVYEFKSRDKSLGTIVAGGRYDGLVGIYSHQSVPAVGISFGIDRIMTLIDVGHLRTYTKLILVNVKPELKRKVIEYAQRFRKSGVAVQVDLMNRNMRKQLEYASAKGVPYVGIVGPREAEANELALKNLATGEQETLKLDDAIDKLLSRGSY